MSIFEDLPVTPIKRKSEPDWHPALKGSFLFVPTAGMRVAPEVLVLEFYRETFFLKRSDEVSAREIDPKAEIESEDQLVPVFTEVEQAVIYASRGRRKRNTQSKEANFYTPTFPGLARRSWLRSKSDRVIKDFLFRALSQKIHGNKRDVESKMSELGDLIYSALAGNNTPENIDAIHYDITGLSYDVLEGCCSEDQSLDRIRHLLGENVDAPDSGFYNSVFSTPITDDPLATQIYDDFGYLCRLEASLDRLQWLDLLKCFLRLATSIWLLAHMRITVIVRDALIQVLNGANVEDDQWLENKIRNRHLDLLRPSITPTNQVQRNIDAYMRARIELKLLVAVVEKYCDESWQDRTITAASGGANCLSVVELLTKARGAKEKIIQELDGKPLASALTRECEKYRAWVSPRKKGSGQGVNYDEFLRVLRRMAKGDEDGGFLLTPSKGGFQVFPGQLMLKLIAFFSGEANKRPNLVLADIEKHFSNYGIDFSKAAGARPLLISMMQEIGMLKGSPDAGDSVAVERQYSLDRSRT